MQLVIVGIVLIVIILFYRFFFVGGLKPTLNSEILGTNTKSNNVFHQFLVTPETQNFKHDGILLCFEKVERKRLIVKSGQPGYFSSADQYALFGIDTDLACMQSKGLSNQAINLVKNTLSDPKPLILTHWLETNEKVHTVKYNAYETIKDVDYDLPMATMGQYEAITTLVKSKMETGNYTHLIIACSGWNNIPDQSSALYQDWITFTKIAANAEDKANDFKPFLIGFTWASRWLIPGISIFNKANDADELGMTHVSNLLWKFILPALNNSNIPIITIGHSFGARVMSRAGHSRFMLKNVDQSTFINKAIDFQGAYPYSRFCEKKGNNGGLYTVDIPVKKHFMTCSKFDYALNEAIWSRGYIGNDKSLPQLQSNMVAKNNFEFTAINGAGKLDTYSGQKSKILVEAKAIVNTIQSKAAGAHSDIRDKEAGQFIWEVLKM